MKCVEEIIKVIDVHRIREFFDANINCPHKCYFHKESFPVHCLLVIDKMIERYNNGEISEEALLAAFLHDIGKPKTAAIKLNGDACFYGHENVTDEEISYFLDRSYPGFNMVATFIRAHMLPLGIGENTPEPYRSNNLQRLKNLVEEYGEGFRKDLDILSLCDQEASVKDESEVLAAEEKAQQCRLQWLF